jgi:CheY-like chemotaxis protein
MLQQERLSALGQMASGIAHDINNAISPVTLYVESLLESDAALSPRARETLPIVLRAIEDVASTVARMRDFYRPREAQSSLEPVDLNLLIQEVLELTRARWFDLPQQRGIVITISRELADGLPPIAGIPGEIREALTNLVINAVDATPEGGTLTLKTLAAGEQIQVEVGDSGIGMDEETVRKRLVDSAPHRARGFASALQLPVLWHVWVQISQSAYPATCVSYLLTMTLSCSRHCRTPLAGEGHSVVAASDAREGIEHFCARQAREPFDVVITDLGMPHLDGRQVAEEIKRASPMVPVILLTGWGRHLLQDGAKPLHIDYILGKPPKLAELRVALARCCATLEAAAGTPKGA